MINSRLRVAAGVAAAAAFALACYLVVHTGRPIAAALFAPAALLSVPLFASSRPPRAEEWRALTDNVTRFRTAGLICFTMAVVMHTAVAAIRMDAATTSGVASLGVAWWVVGFTLVPFTLYYASRRAMLEDDSIDN